MVRRGGLLLLVHSDPAGQLLLVLGGSVGAVLGLGVLAVQGGGAAVGLEVLCGRLVAADLHDAELVPLPDFGGVSGGVKALAREGILSRLVERTKEMCTPILRWLAEQSRHR